MPIPSWIMAFNRLETKFRRRNGPWITQEIYFRTSTPDSAHYRWPLGFPPTGEGELKYLAHSTIGPSCDDVVMFRWKENDGPYKGEVGIETLRFTKDEDGNLQAYGTWCSFDNRVYAGEDGT